MNSLRSVGKIVRLSAQPIRTVQTVKIRTSEHLVEEVSAADPEFIKFKERQAKFQVEDGLPIHLKGGPIDKALYYFTMALCAVGVGMSSHYLWQSANPKKE